MLGYEFFWSCAFLVIGFHHSKAELTTNNDVSLSRTKRSIIYPSGSIMQISLGIGVNPNVEDTIININFGFQMNVPLPTNITQLRNPPNARSNRKLQTQDLYSWLEGMMFRYGFNGSQCLQKSICQLASSDISDGGFFETIIQQILTPSKHGDSTTNGSAGEQIKLYDLAEKYGGDGEDCQDIYVFCPVSPLDLFFVATEFPSQ